MINSVQEGIERYKNFVRIREELRASLKRLSDDLDQAEELCGLDNVNDQVSRDVDTAKNALTKYEKELNAMAKVLDLSPAEIATIEAEMVSSSMDRKAA